MGQRDQRSDGPSAMPATIRDDPRLVESAQRLDPRLARRRRPRPMREGAATELGNVKSNQEAEFGVLWQRIGYRVPSGHGADEDMSQRGRTPGRRRAPPSE